MLGSHCRAIRYEFHNWPLDFFEILGLDKKWCGLIYSDTICWAWMRHDHVWSISGATICHDLSSRSDMITYVWIGLSQSSHQCGANLIWSSWSGFAIWDDMERAYPFRCLHLEPIRSVVTGYSYSPDVFHHHYQGYSQFEIRMDTKGIYIQPDWLSTQDILQS